MRQTGFENVKHHQQGISICPNVNYTCVRKPSQENSEITAAPGIAVSGEWAHDHWSTNSAPAEDARRWFCCRQFTVMVPTANAVVLRLNDAAFSRSGNRMACTVFDLCS